MSPLQYTISVKSTINTEMIMLTFSATGPALQEKLTTMQTLYQKYKSVGLSDSEQTQILQIRKLLQLKTLVMQLIDDSR